MENLANRDTQVVVLFKQLGQGDQIREGFAKMRGKIPDFDGIGAKTGDKR